MSNIERRAAWAVREHFWKVGSGSFPNVAQADQIAKALNEAGFLVDPTTTQGAVSAERHRNAALVRALAGNSWDPSVEAALYEVARQITASGGQSASPSSPRTNLTKEDR